MFKQAALSVLFAALAAANPEPLVDRGVVNCGAVTKIVSLMHQQAVATPFCSSYLHISQVTSTSTQTSTPCAVTTTTTISSTDTVTTTSISTVSGTTTVYPVVAISTTSTCGMGQTVAMSQSTTANQKRGTTTKCTTTTTPTTTPKPTTAPTVPLGIPICLTGFTLTDVSSACSCLNIPTPTKVVVTTTTLPTSTVTSTVCSTAHSTVTVTSTTTTFTSTYSGTQYYTSTFTVLPPPSSTITASQAPQETFGIYSNQNFNGYDLESFNCYTNGPPLPSKYSSTQCNNFIDCVNECAYYNVQGFGASQNVSCGAALYNAPADGSSGYCYLKTMAAGCGNPNNMTNTGVLLPLVATDPQ